MGTTVLYRIKIQLDSGTIVFNYLQEWTNLNPEELERCHKWQIWQKMARPSEETVDGVWVGLGNEHPWERWADSRPDLPWQTAEEQPWACPTFAEAEELQSFLTYGWSSYLTNPEPSSLREKAGREKEGAVYSFSPSLDSKVSMVESG